MRELKCKIISNKQHQIKPVASNVTFAILLKKGSQYAFSKLCSQKHETIYYVLQQLNSCHGVAVGVMQEMIRTLMLGITHFNEKISIQVKTRESDNLGDQFIYSKSISQFGFAGRYLFTKANFIIN